MTGDISWSGGGSHEGHTVAVTDTWPPNFEALEGGRALMTCGRVRCSCGAEWNVGGWPPEWFDAIEGGAA